MNKTLSLTSCQSNALEGLVDWVNNNTETYYAALIGPAGTGKTFLARRIAADCKYKFGVCVSAPTHKAKNIIRRSVEFADDHTVQALCGLAPNLDLLEFDINNPQFARVNQPKIQNYKFLLVDEASMINTDLFNLLIELANTYKVKVLFIGDGFQVPPVKEASSPVFQFCNITYELKTPVRQKPTNPLSLLLSALRCDIATNTEGFNSDLYQIFINNFTTFIENGVDKVISINNDKFRDGRLYRENLLLYLAVKHPVVLIGDEGYNITRDVDLFKETALSTFESGNFQIDPTFARLCAYTNDTVKKWNTDIRNTLYDNPGQLIEGDILLSYTTIRQDRYTNLLQNSEEYVVVSVEESEKDGISGWNIELQSIEDKSSSAVFVVSPSSYLEFIKAHEYKHKGGRMYRKWKAYYGWKRHYICMDSLNKIYEKKQLPNGVRYVQTKNLPKKDLDYGYAITTHKSQGSTYATTLVDAKDMSLIVNMARSGIGDRTMEQAKLEFLNLLYVAISRAKKYSLIYM